MSYSLFFFLSSGMKKKLNNRKSPLDSHYFEELSLFKKKSIP